MVTLIISLLYGFIYDMSEWEVSLSSDFDYNMFLKDTISSEVKNAEFIFDLGSNVHVMGGSPSSLDIMMGQSLNEGMSHQLLIGESLANQRFKKHEIIGEKVILNLPDSNTPQIYEIAGVVKGDNHYWIWDKRTFRPYYKGGSLHLWLDSNKNIEGKKERLIKLGAEAVYYKDALFWWAFLPRLLMAILIIHLIVRKGYLIKNYDWRGVLKDYRRGDFKLKQIAILLKPSIIIVLSLLLLKFIISGIYIPTGWRPNNFLSIKSWGQMLKNNYLTLNHWFDSGFPHIVKIQIPAILIALISVTSLEAIFHAHYKVSADPVAKILATKAFSKIVQ